jgi:hydrophobe/amphiphile efflux-1 (HAE1) family protein
MSQFFIERPVFAWVIAIIIMLSGVLAVYNLPISQYPPIAPPAITISAYYPGASATTVENTVTQIIEQKMTGLENMLYISSSSDSSGRSSVTITFEPGTDPDIAWARVQSRLELAKPLLPDVVEQMGIRVFKSTRNILLIVGLISEDGSMDSADLTDYLATNVENILARVEGVGEAMTFGTQHAMRIWLDPHRLLSYGLTPQDVKQAIRVYNVQVSAGQLGGLPAVEGQKLNVTVNVHSMLTTPEEFARIPLKILPNGSIVYLKDVARIEIGSESYEMDSSYNGKPSGGLAIRLASGANALTTAKAVKAKMEELSKFFPPGLKVIYPHDTTPFISVAIKEVVKTLIEAIILVFFIMLVFLGSFRVTLIPTITIPVVLLGTFAVLMFAGFSINMLTMFAMVLAIGLLVDDAIVVVENVERIMREEGLSPKEAARKSMREITGALIGIGLVLSFVFGPMAFFKGSTGIIYRQFSITLISAMLLSVLIALVLTPALCATIMKPPEERKRGLHRLFSAFNAFFFRTRELYQSQVARIFKGWGKYVLIYVLIVFATGYLFMRLPTAYLPDEDQGSILVQVNMPQGATIERTKRVLKEVETYFLNEEREAVESVMTMAGFSPGGGRGQSAGAAFVKLRDWNLRKRPELKVNEVIKRAMARFSRIRDGLVFAFAPPPIIELATSRGFDLMLQDRGGVGHERLMEAKRNLLFMASKDPILFGVRAAGMDDQPEYKIDIDLKKAGALGLSMADINDTLTTAWGSAYVNDYIEKGRVKRVYVQADAPFRMLPEDLTRWYVRNRNGEMVPFSAFAQGRWTYGSPMLDRYNTFPAVEISGEAAAGRSSGEAMEEMERLVKGLGEGIGYEWTGISYQERLAHGQAPMLYAFSTLVIFLCLAALYESWAIPISILVALPIGLFGGVLANFLRGLPNDIYFQIGLLTTLGLTAKNAILIVQFAKEKMEQGAGLIEATLEGARLRFRPIIMTSLAFNFGVLPLALARGAGAGAMKAIGTCVTGGMLAATFIAIFYIPLFFVGVMKIFRKGR